MKNVLPAQAAAVTAAGAGAVAMAAGADTAAVMTETVEIGVDAMIVDLVEIAVNPQSVFQPKEQRYALLLFLFHSHHCSTVEGREPHRPPHKHARRAPGRGRGEDPCACDFRGGVDLYLI